MKVYKAYKYYKYVYNDWTQPVLTSNGTMGGTSFACSQSAYYSDTSETAQYAFYAFDGVTADSGHEWQINSVSTSSYYWISWYNPKPLKISKIKVLNSQANYVVKNWNLQVSSDNKTWTTIASGTNTVTAGLTSWTITVPATSQVASKYYRLYVSPNNATALMIKELTITATEQTVIEGDCNDYDYKEAVYSLYKSGGGIIMF